MPFDCLRWGMPPQVLAATDTAQLLALIVADRVLQDATRSDYSHIDKSGKGTFELPMASKLGSTVVSASMLNPLPGFVDVNPANDLRISPMAATCSGLHESSAVKRQTR